jgi:hypothetical protein
VFTNPDICLDINGRPPYLTTIYLPNQTFDLISKITTFYRFASTLQFNLFRRDLVVFLFSSLKALHCSIIDIITKNAFTFLVFLRALLVRRALHSLSLNQFIDLLSVCFAFKHISTRLLASGLNFSILFVNNFKASYLRLNEQKRLSVQIDLTLASFFQFVLLSLPVMMQRVGPPFD